AQGTDPTDILSRTSLDSDGDHMSDDWETAHALDPQVDDGDEDPDLDLLTNYREYLWETDPHDPDSDHDGYADGFERTHGFDPSSAADATLDTDGDNLPDLWELTHGLDPDNPADAAGNADGDSLTNAQEFNAGTNPLLADTDGDGDNDDVELANETNPLDRHDYTLVDTDNDGLHDAWEAAQGLNVGVNDADDDLDDDGLSNAQEFAAGTSASSADTDGDGYSDSFELAQGYDPLSAADALLDFDQDGMTDLWELAHGLNPNNASDAAGDVDHDGVSNHDEFLAGTNPLIAPAGDGGTGSTDQGGGNGGTDGLPDQDMDGMPDSWETDHALNPEDPADSARDFDYDRLSNLDEYRLGKEPNTDWIHVPVEGGLPYISYQFSDLYTDSGRRLFDLNDLGEVATIKTGSQSGQFSLWIWDKGDWIDGEWGGAVDRSGGDGGHFSRLVARGGSNQQYGNGGGRVSSQGERQRCHPCLW
ncbi:MAG: hypothetical protein KDM91_20015, partial [Verrucomicrobiae bacterium]|nr:hypothetical protein [Verrucomicrobiae bacterium]